MNEAGFEKRLVNVTGEFEKFFGVDRLGDYSWYGSVWRDTETGDYYVYEIKYQAADSEGWRRVGSTFESAIEAVEFSKMR